MKKRKRRRAGNLPCKNMNGFSQKIHITLEAPTEEQNQADRERILRALEEKGYSPIRMSLSVLRSLYPLCRESEWDITVTVVFTEDGAVVTSVEAGDTTGEHYGIAVDLGSTSVVMQLVDMNTGEVRAEAREMNGQIAYGNDILTRIVYANESSEHLQEVSRATLDTINLLLGRFCKETGIPAEKCPMMIISGNTTMIHFLLGLNASTVFFAPYAPVACDPGFFSGHEIGLGFPGIVYIVPAIANYLGGDITSGLLTTDFYRRDGLAAFFDIGTNGELVIGNSSFLIAGAGAAGPALEGDISKYGMRAGDGAIDTVTIRGAELSFTTIGNKKPVGICGSGIIDLMAQMRLNGWIDVTGTLKPGASPRIRYVEELEEDVAVYALPEESGNGEMLYFSQTDICQYLSTKAAAHTMVDCLLESTGLTEEDLDQYYTSGAFGTYANLESAITIGIFPDLPRERFVCLNNSSLNGARELLLNRERMEDIEYLRETIYYVQFATVPDFVVKMQASKFIPHTNIEKYPSVVAKLKENGVQ